MNYTPKRHEMFSGQGVAESLKYKKLVGKSGNTWLVAIQPNEGDNVYITNNPENSGGQGFGGAHLNMELEDGTVFVLKGGWHANSNSLFEDTGYDCRDKHLTFVVIAKDRKFVPYLIHGELIDVIYMDDKPTIGEFDRGEKLAQQIANAQKERVCRYTETSGGSSSGFVEPL